MSYIYPSVLNGKTQYKLYFVFESNKIYLGTYPSIETAEKVLKEAETLMASLKGPPHFEHTLLDYKKVVSLCNFRDHKKYLKNPIYLYATYFHYYLSKDCILIFDLRDLLYFSTYKIYKRGNYLYTQDSISQKSILSRFGIHNHSVISKDYFFKNGNPYDFRFENLVVVNNYKGVKQKVKNNQFIYISYIHIKTNLILGHYESEIAAAIAYNKAIDLLRQQNRLHDYTYNTIPYITEAEYMAIYNSISLSPRLFFPEQQRKRVLSTKKLRGISKDHNSYKVHIGYQGKQLYLGMYSTEKRAAQAYNYASFYLYGRQGYINEVSPLIDDNDSVKIAKFLEKYHILKSDD